MSGFYEKVYRAVSRIPRGKVATYGQIAALCGSPRASRAVGWALHVNPYPGVVPCHRVVNREGALCKAFVFGGPGVQQKLLEDEGVVIGNDGKIDLSRYLWDISDQI